MPEYAIAVIACGAVIVILLVLMFVMDILFFSDPWNTWRGLWRLMRRWRA